MEVRLGYKHTEVGLIPADWETIPLGRLTSSVEYGSSAKSKPTGSTPVLRMGNLQGGQIDWTNLVFTNDEAEITRYKLHPGDVLFNRTNTIELVGKAALFKGERAAIFAGYLIRVKAGESLDPRFLNYVLNAEFSRKYSIKVLSVAVGQANINSQKLKTYPIPFPPTKTEQKAIAEALSDADALIESLERLISKKRLIKQGAMQELLTGKKRLPGFSGEWIPIKLGEMAPLQRGFDLPTAQLSAGPYPVVYSNGVLNYHSSFQVKGPGVVTGRSGTIGAVTFVEHDFWPHNTALWVTSFRNNDPKFVFYLYSFIGLEQFATGSGVPTLNRNDVHAHHVHMPPAKAEQVAIAGVLTDMDVDLAEVVKKLLKTRQIKQGMMQELLTGRIRLV